MGEMRTHVFLDVASGVELVMPTYAEAGWGWKHGMGMEKVTLDQLGDVAVPTARKLCEQPLEVLLPARDYSFNVPGARTDPWVYIEALEKRCDAKSLQRYIVTGTPVNVAAYIEDVDYTEPDGTGDMRVTIRLQEAKTPKVIPAADSLGLELGVREEHAEGLMGSTYTVEQGDTMWAIARKFYGDGSLCWALAAYNDIANANIIRVGQVLQIPPGDQLPVGAKATSGSGAKISQGKGTAAKTIEELYAHGPTPTVINKLEAIWQKDRPSRGGPTPTAINAMDRLVTAK